MTMEKVTAKIFRYDPTIDAEAHYDTFEVPHDPGMRVLDVLFYIHENLDPSLAFRYCCRRRRCGSCGLMVNGKPVLACMAEAKEKMVLEPSPNLPVIRDLVVETAEYEERIQEIGPFLQRDKPPAKEPEKLFPRDFATVRPLNQCIECFSCMNACPVNGLKWPGFAGPTTLVQLARRLFDPRDGLDRLPDAAQAGFQHCVSCYSCVNACPVEIGVLEGAIEKIREKFVVSKKTGYAKYNEVWKDLVVTNGLVNPSILMRRTSSLGGLLSNMGIGLRFFSKGKISLGSKRLNKISEVRLIAKETGEK